MNLLNPLLGGGSFIRQPMGNDLNFICDHIQGVQTGEDREVIFENSAYFFIGIIDQIKGRSQSTCKEEQECDHPGHDLRTEGMAHEE